MTPATATIYPGHRVLAMFPFYNEGSKLRTLAEKLKPGLVDEFVAVNDGSTDEGPDILRQSGVIVFDQSRSGIGATAAFEGASSPRAWRRARSSNLANARSMTRSRRPTVKKPGTIPACSAS